MRGCAMRSRDALGRAPRRGAVLLEAIVALTMLAIGGVAMVALASASLRAIVRVRTAEAELRRANALLSAVALWPREDLDRHLGTHPQGPWQLRVDRPSATLYVLTLGDSADPALAHPLLTTSLYRPETTHAAP